MNFAPRCICSKSFFTFYNKKYDASAYCNMLAGESFHYISSAICGVPSYVEAYILCGRGSISQACCKEQRRN